MNPAPDIHTIAQLRASGYQVISIKEEMRRNLSSALTLQQNLFPGILGYEDTVIPEITNAVLSRHDFILLGLRGQGKTRILRSMVNLLDEYIPVIEDCEINDNPFHPLCRSCREKIAEMGDDTPVSWLHRSERYNEKLATPDVSIADLFGDIDPIKAATRRLHYAHEGVIHWGIIPRTNRGIFVINELPDLQPRIQVGLLNILEENDLQIRGFPIRIPLDMMIAFSANPEDYTNRGNIITPLKDRISSQIITHYPASVETGIAITGQEAFVQRTANEVNIPYYFKEIIENIAMEARDNELIDPKSGVSARMSISAMENLLSSAEQRKLRNNDIQIRPRISDFRNVIPAITGKIELVYEGEQEGITNVANILVGKAIKKTFLNYFSLPGKKSGAGADSEFESITRWFSGENMVSLLNDCNDEQFVRIMGDLQMLEPYIQKYFPAAELQDPFNMAVVKEFVLEALYQSSYLSKFSSGNQVSYRDLVDSIFNSLPDEDSDLDVLR
jgi:magnesium chelatase subunit I